MTGPCSVRGNIVGMLDDEPVGKLKVFVYMMYFRMLLDKDRLCLRMKFSTPCPIGV